MSAEASEERVAIDARVTGRVQGVGFRWWTCDEAEALGLAGWVRNEPDGSVRAHLEGPRRAVEAMVAALHRGPSAARVASVEVTPASPSPEPGHGVRILR
ncbi:acylphosphatase [Meinhardsimonia xiamenensis]|jgi:acylphosphatase|uniref:Acylphosphatase n=1 Tax=Meinhardsimonia xiamenensis TaxID=990712 RepID=A0A1G9CB03_9RHOB|nr:acylphosphatase [Meinhardsimonia xiamenensis]PRX38424.1 acylphosphatase [Meinhardsimonia xiamenensis]SDK48868.1 acylphosphatase [Meinhardsimonia xiamenensis]